MLNRLKWKIKERIIMLICDHVAIGGRCGGCGKWVDNELLPRYWRVTICQECIDDAESWR
jgi:hypothetical protein